MTPSPAPPAPQFDPARAAPFLTSASHNGWLGLRYHAHGPDWVELELPWRADLIGEEERQVLASGPVVSLMDMASGLAIWTATGVFMPIATLDLRVDYTRAAAPRGPVFGRATCYRTTRSAAFVHGLAHEGDAEDPVARMQAVFMTIAADPRRLPGD
jgi:acyl-coenzyme A thioesterase PaaI-like protein